MDIRLLQPANAEAAVALRRSALTTDAYAFAERLDSDPALNVEFVRQRLAASGVHAGAVVVGAFDPELVGMVGVYRVSPEADGTRVWGFYVESNRRRSGLGRALLEQVLAYAQQMTGVRHVELSVADAAVSAIRLYESAGFATVEHFDGKRQMRRSCVSRTECRIEP